MTFVLFALLSWCAGWLVLVRIGRHNPSPAAVSKIAEQLSIIIPARNEEKNLPKLLRSLAEQSVRPKEIIVVDDDSADQTLNIAQHYGVKVVASKPLPGGWRGKTWACQQGASVASGAYYLFLDADTWFEPDGLKSALSMFPCAGRGALSLAPYHFVENFYEQFSAIFNLVMLAGTGAFTLLGDQIGQQGLVGQFLLIDRANYEKVGGHESVKSRILENFWLAKELRAASVELCCRTGRGALSFRMYPGGWRQLIDGWTKGFASGASQTPLPILLLLIVWFGGVVLVATCILMQPSQISSLVLYIVWVAQFFSLLRQVGSFHWLTVLFFPVFVFFFFIVFTRSLLRSGKNVNWKGRVIRAG